MARKFAAESASTHRRVTCATRGRCTSPPFLASEKVLGRCATVGRSRTVRLDEYTCSNAHLSGGRLIAHYCCRPVQMWRVDIHGTRLVKAMPHTPDPLVAGARGRIKLPKMHVNSAYTGCVSWSGASQHCIYQASNLYSAIQPLNHSCYTCSTHSRILRCCIARSIVEGTDHHIRASCLSPYIGRESSTVHCKILYRTTQRDHAMHVPWISAGLPSLRCGPQATRISGNHKSYGCIAREMA